MAVRLRAAGHVRWTRTGEEAVLLDLRSSTYFALDAVGARVWELLSTRAIDEDELVCALLAEFDVERQVLEPDLATLLADLRERRLIEPDPEEPVPSSRSG